MADLFVHYTCAHVLGRPLPDPRRRLLFAIGNCLPDILFKGLLYLTASPTWYVEPTHSPVMLAVACFAIAFLFEPVLRRAAWGLLFAGSLCHLLVDLGKGYMGTGVIPWAYPFSMRRAELGWYLTDESPLAWPWCVAAIAAAEVAWRAWRRRAGKAGPTPT